MLYINRADLTWFDYPKFSDTFLDPAVQWTLIALIQDEGLHTSWWKRKEEELCSDIRIYDSVSSHWLLRLCFSLNQAMFSGLIWAMDYWRWYSSVQWCWRRASAAAERKIVVWVQTDSEIHPEKRRYFLLFNKQLILLTELKCFRKMTCQLSAHITRWWGVLELMHMVL